MPGLRERRALLAILSVPHLGPVTLHRVLAELGSREGLARFFHLHRRELTRRFRLRPAAVSAVCERGAALLDAAATLEQELRERDVHWLMATDADYPRRLSQAPWSPPPSSSPAATKICSTCPRWRSSTPRTPRPGR